MKFKSTINFKDYLKLNYTLTYKSKWIIFISIIGLLMLLAAGLYYSGLVPWLYAEDSPPRVPIIFGLFTSIGVPCSVYFTAKRNFKSSERLQEEIEYELTNDKFKMTGSSFSNEMTWDKTYKIQELKHWFIVYQNRKVANLIPKRSLSSEDTEYLRNLFRTIKNARLKLK